MALFGDGYAKTNIEILFADNRLILNNPLAKQWQVLIEKIMF